MPLRRLDFSLSADRMLAKFGPKQKIQLMKSCPILFSLLINPQVTLFCHGSLLEEVFCPDECDLGEGIEHGEDHPDVNHLDVGRRWQSLRDSDETGKEEFLSSLLV